MRALSRSWAATSPLANSSASRSACRWSFASTAWALRQERLLVQQVRLGRLEVRARHLQARLGAREGGRATDRARSPSRSARSRRAARRPSRTARARRGSPGCSPDVFAKIGVCRFGEHVPREGERHVQGAALGLDDAHLDLAVRARHGPGLLVPEAADDQRRDDAQQHEEDQRRRGSGGRTPSERSPWRTGGCRGGTGPPPAGRGPPPACRPRD